MLFRVPASPHRLAFFLPFCACTASQTIGGSPASHAASDSAAGDSTEVIDSGDGDSGVDTSGSDTSDSAEVETWPKQCDSLYDPDDLPTFDLDFTDAEWTSLGNDCNIGSQAYHPVSFSWNGETVAAKARLKGNWTWNCGKYQFVISFNEDDPDARFHGLRKIVLDAPWYDRTMLHERLAYQYFESLGLPYSCANSVQLNINGEYYGLYANLERLDHEYLERNFEDATGNLYQAGSELKTNEDVADTSDLTALKAASTADELASLIDLDEATAEWAAEAMIPALDNYWAGVEINYYIYDYPGRGFLYLPYDMDLIFGDSAYGDGSPIWPDAVNADPITYEHNGWYKEELFKTVLRDPAWCKVYVSKMELARAAYDPVALAAQVSEWDAQIYAAYDTDPRKNTNTAEHEVSIGQLQDFFAARADVVDAWLAEGGHCPARW